jgi:AcrR family transcriptional regulator
MSVQTPQRRLDRESRREQILESALKVFSRNGFHSTHVSDIVEEAGIARGTFYLHFSSKKVVFDALIDTMLGYFLDLPREPWEEAASLEDVRRQLESAWRKLLLGLREQRLLALLLLEEAVGLDKGYRDRLDDHYRSWRERIRTTLTALVRKGLVRRDIDLDLTPDLVIGMAERVMRRYLLAPAEPQMERLVQAMTTFELGGMRAL